LRLQPFSQCSNLGQEARHILPRSGDEILVRNSRADQFDVFTSGGPFTSLDEAGST